MPVIEMFHVFCPALGEIQDSQVHPPHPWWLYIRKMSMGLGKISDPGISWSKSEFLSSFPPRSLEAYIHSGTLKKYVENMWEIIWRNVGMWKYVNNMNKYVALRPRWEKLWVVIVTYHRIHISFSIDKCLGTWKNFEFSTPLYIASETWKNSVLFPYVGSEA